MDRGRSAARSKGSDLTVSNAYPRHDAHGATWSDTPDGTAVDDRAPRQWDGARAGDDDRQLRAVGPPRGPRREPPQARYDDERDVPPHAPPPSVAAGPTAEDVAAQDRAAARREADEIEETVPAGQRLRESATRLLASVRRSVPLRTVLFVLPPLVLPALAFDLSLGGAIAVTLLLLWVAAAAGAVATMMFDGSDQLALRAIERQLGAASGGNRPGDDEALLAVGAQLDALNDRLDHMEAGRRRAAPEGAVDHRPQEHWSTAREVDQYEGYDQDVVEGPHWSPPRWER